MMVASRPAQLPGVLQRRGAVLAGANLPDDILHVVFQCASHDARYTPGKWKASLTLLAVCREWRRVARPLVYKHLCIVCGDDSVLLQQPALDGTISEPTHTPLATNLALTTELGHERLVRDIELTLNYVQSPFMCLRNVVAMLGVGGRRWPGARTLRIRLECNLYVLNQERPAIEHYAADIADAVGSISQLMPSVAALVCHSPENSYIAAPLFGALGSSYAAQATRIVCSNLLAVHDTCTFDRLTRLDIDLAGNTACLLPKVSPLPLVALHLRRVPHSFDWANFAAEDPWQPIVFARLRTLKLNYQTPTQPNEPASPDGHRRAIHGRLEFPRLTSLHIVNLLGRSPILECGVFPGRLDDVVLSCSVGEVYALGSANIPKIGHLSMTLEYQSGEADIDVFAAVNRMAAKADGRVDARVLVMADLTWYSLDSTASRHITTITVLTPLNARALLALLERLPSLTSLTATRMLCGQIPIVTTDTDCISARPLNCSIQDLTLRSYVAELDISRLATLVKHLVVRLPALRNLHAIHVPEAPIKQFVQAAIEHYPHLANVTLDLKQRRPSHDESVIQDICGGVASGVASKALL
ncbi:hypothetical protein H4R19_000950 [Coemansia spiralis]|nr:hypothetical protein H4R19_000950 [Coemansia spiralis]